MSRSISFQQCVDYYDQEQDILNMTDECHAVWVVLTKKRVVKYESSFVW